MSNFNPRSRVGSDIGQHRTIIMRQVFQSTLPRGERRPIGERGSAVACISIHAPAWGATIAPYINDPTFSISIHAPAWGATHYACVKIHCFLNFNPRSRVGSDIGRGLKKMSKTISIHAPAWGATGFGASIKRAFTISIHAPAWGATGSKGGNSGKADISIHAPAWGATHAAHRRFGC